jgi:hypothetical protein
VIGAARIGVELTPRRVRAVRAGAFGGAARTVDMAWDPSRPRETVEALAESLGGASAISLSVGLGFLHVKHVDLPPAPLEARARMLALEPERFFAERDAPLVVALAHSANLAFAVPRALMDQWVAAFEEWGPVVRVEPSPVSAARALGKDATGAFQLEAGDGEMGVVEVQHGELHGARRRPTESGDAGVTQLPARLGVPAAFAVASGAARAGDDPLGAMLVTDEVRARIAGRRRRAVLVSSFGTVAALAFALWAADGWRERTLRALENDAAAAAARAAPASAAMQSLLALETEATSIHRLASQRPDPLAAMAALGTVLPRDVVVLSAKATGDDWQLDGTARDASALVPMLDKDGRFENAHFLSASSRYREGSRSYETFSIALRYRPRP